MDNCVYCGAQSYSSSYVKEMGGYVVLCKLCRKKLKQKDIEEKLKDVSRASDFKSWSKEDMSEAFWIHLGKYQKAPNRESLVVMYRALLWAHHDDHGLSNSFSHALEWCGINIDVEWERKDLPERLEG